jgi:signal transduction histidine kinase
MAGLSYAATQTWGRWGVIAVATAARERDRQTRALWRLVLGVVVASSLVLVFGGFALHMQRTELELARKLAVAQIERERDEQLLRASRVATMGTFAMGIAHEVSTPLGVIVGRAELLRPRVETDPRAVHGVDVILEQADRIRQIVRRFLDLARGGSPSLDLADPADITRRAAEAVQHRLAKANVSLATEAPDGMPGVRCDRALLEHALVNLLLNACDACGEGGHVSIRTLLDADRVGFEVTDDGVGISPEHAARAAEPFFTTKLEQGGTGLGLAIATEIAKSHHGRLTLGPRAPRGTRAWLEIPIAS